MCHVVIVDRYKLRRDSLRVCNESPLLSYIVWTQQSVACVAHCCGGSCPFQHKSLSLGIRKADAEVQSGEYIEMIARQRDRQRNFCKIDTAVLQLWWSKYQKIDWYDSDCDRAPCNRLLISKEEKALLDSVLMVGIWASLWGTCLRLIYCSIIFNDLMYISNEVQYKYIESNPPMTVVLC